MNTCKHCGDGTEPGRDICPSCEKPKEQTWRAPADNSRRRGRRRV